MARSYGWGLVPMARSRGRRLRPHCGDNGSSAPEVTAEEPDDEPEAPDDEPGAPDDEPEAPAAEEPPVEEPRATCVARGRRGDEEADPATLTASARDGGCSSTTGAAAAAGTCGCKKCAIAIRRRATPPYAGSYPCSQRRTVLPLHESAQPGSRQTEFFNDTIALVFAKCLLWPLVTGP